MTNNISMFQITYIYVINVRRKKLKFYKYNKQNLLNVFKAKLIQKNYVIMVNSMKITIVQKIAHIDNDKKLKSKEINEFN